MDKRNCGDCQPCAHGNYDQCQTISEDRTIAELINAIEQIQACLKNHKQYANMGDGYLQKANEIISRTVAKYSRY